VQDPRQLVVSPDSALTGAILFAAGVAFAPVTIAVFQRMIPRRAPAPIPWGWSLGLIPVLALSALLALPWEAWTSWASDPLNVLAATTSITAGIGLCLLWFAARRGESGTAALGLQKGGNLRAIGAGALVYVLCAPGLDGLVRLTPWLLARFGLPDLERPDDLLQTLSAGKLAWLFFLFVVAQPFFLELLFRGFLQPLFVRRSGPRLGIALTSLLFAGLYGTDFLPLFAFSILLGGVMFRSQRLLAVCGVHSLHNALQFVGLILASSTAEALGSGSAILPS
jgi:membrane protease YdiL (CAAX protease family)